jgi:hypothetical protein
VSYLAIARTIPKRNEINEKRRTVGRNDIAAGYEKNEENEESPESGQWVPHPLMSGILVYRGPVAATTVPEGWAGTAPTGCSRPAICQPLGPCKHFQAHGQCWKDGVS